MEKLLNTLEDFNDCIDYKVETALMTDGIIDSVDLVELVAKLEENFDIDIPLDEIIPENFDSAKDIWNMIRKLENKNEFNS